MSNKVLVVGASGLLGNAAIWHFSRLPEWDVVAIYRRPPLCINENISSISVDLTDADHCSEVFGMQIGPDRPCSLMEELPKWQDEWSAIVNKYHLNAPEDIREFIGESPALADYCLASGMEAPVPSMLESTIKLRQAGFHDCVDTEDMFGKWIERLQKRGFLPPVH